MYGFAINNIETTGCRFNNIWFNITVTTAQASKFQNYFFQILTLQTGFVDSNSALMMFSSLLFYVYTSSPQQAILIYSF